MIEPPAKTASCWESLPKCIACRKHAGNNEGGSVKSLAQNDTGSLRGPEPKWYSDLESWSQGKTGGWIGDDRLLGRWGLRIFHTFCWLHTISLSGSHHCVLHTYCGGDVNNTPTHRQTQSTHPYKNTDILIVLLHKISSFSKC